MLSFCKLLAICVLDGFMLLMIPSLKDVEFLILYDTIVLKCCYVMLCNVLVTLRHYRSLQVNHFDSKSDLNSCFRKKLPTLRCHDPVVIS